MHITLSYSNTLGIIEYGLCSTLSANILTSIKKIYIYLFITAYIFYLIIIILY